jgi:hypothetical protein
MEKVAIVGCGAYMDSGYGCPGEWRCLKAAALGEGSFENPSLVTLLNVNVRADPLLRIWAWR